MHFNQTPEIERGPMGVRLLQEWLGDQDASRVRRYSKPSVTRFGGVWE